LTRVVIEGRLNNVFGTVVGIPSTVAAIVLLILAIILVRWIVLRPVFYRKSEDRYLDY